MAIIKKTLLVAFCIKPLIQNIKEINDKNSAVHIINTAKSSDGLIILRTTKNETIDNTIDTKSVVTIKVLYLMQIFFMRLPYWLKFSFHWFIRVNYIFLFFIVKVFISPAIIIKNSPTK